ncbi:protein TonB [Herbaspirillum sp. Sphag1AN]|uniref:energy transducer TonB n=1 Tax=unclassified Herbaspirillum TaxID=2624150 RepID=UPI001613F4EF|nr:protein TonB [Herbaspirillum sp. Sphag1AN]MBB3246982.1 protein TonB [Herbaspirillum sp. Sphag64]
MKPFVENRLLTGALALSALVHLILLGIHFAAPASFRLRPSDPGLEVILVNAKHAQAPQKADAIAQANLDGGGNADDGRAKSPLPDMHKVEEGDSIKAVRRQVAELEAQQQKVLSQLNQSTTAIVSPQRQIPQPLPLQPNARDLQDAQAIARMEAEVNRNIEAYNKRPKKTQITARTREANYAIYYKSLQEKIEKLGTLNFPQQDGKKLYGELIVYIPVFQDGSIYEKEGGARVEASSGNPVLDRAALAIVRRSAPFGSFPASMRSSGSNEVWEVITRFRFTHQDTLEAEVSTVQ